MRHAVRDLLDRMEKSRPDAKSRAARISVYAVAAGEALGMSDDALLDLAEAAALCEAPEILGLTEPRSSSRMAANLVGVASAFDGWVQMHDFLEAERHLKSSRGSVFESRVADAVLEVSHLVQPIGAD